MSDIDSTIQDPNATQIKRALLSVSNKDGIVEFAKSLESYDIEILSTGGTAKLLKENGVKVKDVSEHTGFPEIMDGRVKTLHPKIHGGLLARRDNDTHVQAMQSNDIGGIDLLVVNLYPFVETINSNADFDTCIENIDIGGPAMIRAAAKNHDFVTVITDPYDYQAVLNDLNTHKGYITRNLRRKLAAMAYERTATYDSAIAGWFDEQINEAHPRRISFAGRLKQTLRYGENPHQSADLYITTKHRPGAATATQIQGKELSYNNINDTDAAFELVSEFSDPTVAIIKHANPCGVASGKTLLDAYHNAFRCDPVSAFGGIIAVNQTLDAETAEAMIKPFVEVIIAPEIEAGALDILKRKDKVRVLTTGGLADPAAPQRFIKCIAGGLLVQDSDTGIITKDDLKIVTDREPTEQELKDLLFAFRVAKHVKSNAIVYAKDGATAGIGAGQMSRVDSARIAAWKATEAAKEAGLPDPLTKGSVVASDAFFPFADGLISAAEAGVTAVIQPGGSIRDDEVIEAANERGLAMVLTGIRHFKH